MSFPNQDSIRGTIQSLKEIVVTLQGEDHESSRLIHQMEALVQEIEHKIKHLGKTSAQGQGSGG